MLSSWKQFALAFCVGLLALGLPLGVVAVKLSQRRAVLPPPEEVYTPQPSDAFTLLAAVAEPGQPPDTLVLVRLDPEAGSVTLALPPPELMVEDEGTLDALAGIWRQAGPERAARACSAALGIPIDRWLTLPTSGFIELADALGAVDYPLEQPLRADDGTLLLEPGRQLLDGRKLRALLLDGKGDPARETERLALAGSLLAEATRQRMSLLSPTAARAVFEAAVNAGATNLTISDYEARRRSCAYLRDNLQRVRVLQMEGEYNAGRNTFVLHAASASALQAAFAPGENQSPSVSSSATR